MKIITKTLLLVLGVALFIAPTQGDAKEQHGLNKSDSRKATVHGSHSSSKGHAHSSNKRKHNGNSYRGHSHNSKKKHYTTGKKHHNSHYRGHKYKHKKRHHSYHYGHKKRNSFAKGLVLGATLHHAFGPHGRYYRGHAWCPSHYLYHTHGYVHTYHYGNHHTYYGPRKVESYIELDEGMCYKVTEYSNGDQKRKRIRDYHCDDLDEWAEWEDWE